jgi:hypothetical protein
VVGNNIRVDVVITHYGQFVDFYTCHYEKFACFTIIKFMIGLTLNSIKVKTW